jgi:hypothetical protein
LAIAEARFALKIRPPLLGAKRSDGCGRLALRECEENLRARADLVGLLEELPFVCPVVVAIGSTVMIINQALQGLPQ